MKGISGPNTVFVNGDPETPDIEENTGVDFPGVQFDCLLDKTWREVERSQNSFSYSYDLLVVELQSNDSPFVFKYNKSPGTFGKCDACYTTTILKIKCPCNKMFYCDLACKKKDERYHLSNCEYENRVDNQTLESLSFQPEDGARRGVVGLYNLGNTCFMNSALQCLSNTWPLTTYFLGCHFKSEVNMVNALGTQGKLAFQYARLLNELWNKGSDTFSPNSLKNAVGEKNTMFQGYS